MNKSKLTVIIILLLIFISTGLHGSLAAPGVITLDPKITYQTIEGWEATAQAGQYECPSFSVYKDHLFDLAVNDLGINRLRVEINSGIENPVDYFSQFKSGQINFNQWESHWYDIVNDDNNPNTINPKGFQFGDLDYIMANLVLPMRQLLANRGEKLFLNFNYVDFGSSAFEHKDHPDEYGEFVLAVYQHMQDKYGFVPDAWEVLLEPDNHTGWTATQLGNAIVAAGDRLKAAGFTPHFIAPSNADMGNAINYFDDMIKIPGVLPYLSEFSYHRYAGVSDTNLQTIANIAKQYKLKTAMLEHWGSGYEDLHQDLKVGLNSAWQQYTLAFCVGDNGAQYYTIDTSNPASPKVNLSNDAKFFRQYFKYIRRGAVRIGASSDDGDLDPLAFINADGKYVVVVKVNGNNSFSLQGLPAGSYGMFYTTSSQSNVQMSDVTLASGQLIDASIPDSGVITIYAKTGDLTPKPTASSHVFLPMAVKKITNQLNKQALINPSGSVSGCSEH